MAIGFCSCLAVKIILKKTPKITDNFREIKKAFQKYSESSWEFQIHDDENRKKNRCVLSYYKRCKHKRTIQNVLKNMFKAALNYDERK